MSRWMNPLRMRVREGYSGWSASYKRGRSSWRVSGCRTRDEAIAELRLFVFGDKAAS